MNQKIAKIESAFLVANSHFDINLTHKKSPIWINQNRAFYYLDKRLIFVDSCI